MKRKSKKSVSGIHSVEDPNVMTYHVSIICIQHSPLRSFFDVPVMPSILARSRPAPYQALAVANLQFRIISIAHRRIGREETAFLGNGQSHLRIALCRVQIRKKCWDESEQSSLSSIYSHPKDATTVSPNTPKYIHEVCSILTVFLIPSFTSRPSTHPIPTGLSSGT